MTGVNKFDFGAPPAEMVEALMIRNWIKTSKAEIDPNSIVAVIKVYCSKAYPEDTDLLDYIMIYLSSESEIILSGESAVEFLEQWDEKV